MTLSASLSLARAILQLDTRSLAVFRLDLTTYAMMREGELDLIMTGLGGWGGYSSLRTGSALSW